MASKSRVKAAIDFFDGKREPNTIVPPGFFTAGQWCLKLNATDNKHVRQQLHFMVQDGMAEVIEGFWKGQKASYFKLLPPKRCSHCKSIIGTLPRKLFSSEYPRFN